MRMIERLSTTLGVRSEVPNQELGADIVARQDVEALRDVVSLLNDKSRAIQGDAIKVLDEIGQCDPALIAPYHQVFIEGLTSRYQRVVWGAMTAIASITPLVPREIFASLEVIVGAADCGSVIARDHAVGVLCHLSSMPEFSEKAFPHLIFQLRKAPVLQLPMYAEKALVIRDPALRERIAAVLTSRLADLDRESAVRRVGKVLKKLA